MTQGTMAAYADTPLLATKLVAPPPRPNLVPRPRLLRRLYRDTRQKVCLIAAPAGFGKSTLLGAWLERGAERVAWLSLDAGDSDVARFWSYALAALGAIAPGIREELAGMLQVPAPPMDAFLTRLINGLAAFREDVTLVLDDYQTITDVAVHQSLAFVIDHLPSGVRIIIATRADPPLPLARLRARGELTELRGADLRFSLEEAAAFLCDHMHLRLTESQVAALESHTEGWIAGLQLAALAMQHRADVEGFLAAFTGSQRFILSYLLDEVLAQQPERVQRFLLRTSILDRLSGPICDAVTEELGGQELLEALERDNLFTVPLDDEGHWYRYHHLFAEVLQHRLRQTEGDLAPTLHARASLWYERHGDVGDAVRHALACEDVARAARLVGQAAGGWLSRGEVAELRRWLDALPTEVVRASPLLSVCSAWALITPVMGLTHAWMPVHTPQVAGVEEYARDAACALRALDERGAIEPAERANVAGQIAAIHAWGALLRGDVQDAIATCGEALGRVPADNLVVRALLLHMLGNAYHLTGEVSAATVAFQQARVCAEGANHLLLALSALGDLAQMYELQGRLHDVERTSEEALELAVDREGRPLPVAAVGHLRLGRVAYERNDLDRAASHCAQVTALARRGGLDALEIEAAFVRAQIQSARGDYQRALSVLGEADDIGRRARHRPTMLRIGALLARVSLARGDVEAAAGWAREAGLRMDDDTHETLGQLAIGYTTLARILLTQGSLAGVAEMLARVFEPFEPDRRVARAIEVTTLQALAFQAQGDTVRAVTTLERALALGEQEGYVRTFVDEGAPLAALLLLVARRRSPVAPYAAAVLTAFGTRQGLARDSANQAEARPANAPFRVEMSLGTAAAAALIEPLSDRELEVLRLLAAGFSHRQVADRLVVSVATVKKHVENIHHKLLVHNRTQALARARELGII